MEIPSYMKGRYVELAVGDLVVTGKIIDITDKTIALEDGSGRSIPYETKRIKGIKKIDSYMGLKLGDLVSFYSEDYGNVTGYFGDEDATSIEVFKPNAQGLKEIGRYPISGIKNFRQLDKEL